MPALADCFDFSDVKRACTPAIVKGITQQDSDKAAERVEAVEEWPAVPDTPATVNASQPWRTHLNRREHLLSRSS
jgi:hypothetical protein